jgi:hypothetical protein
VLPNRLTLLYSENYYKEENYLTVKIESLYLTPPYSNGLSILVCQYISIVMDLEVLVVLITRLMRRDLDRLVEGMEPVELWDEG